MSLSALVRAGRSLAATSLVRTAASLLVAGSCAHAAQSGLDGPEPVGPYLNGNFPATEPSSAGEWSVQETYTGININLPMHLTPYPGTNKLLCVAKEGRIFLFEDNPAAATTETFLDIRSRTFTSSDCGMTWLVFHPDFGVAGNPDRGYVYVTYKWAPAGGDGHQAYWRLSRFTVPDGTQAADPASELVLIQQYDRQEFHDSGCMMFGPDGYLYVGIGDEGGANDQYNVGQKINDRLFSGILRIDVDNKPGNQPVATRRQPAQLAMPSGWPASFTTGYSIPADNPFVTAGKLYLEEFYALGLRQPYRFSYDASSNTTWIGESGQDTSEELSILAPGANYGWPFREGSVAGPKAPPATTHGTLTAPVWDVLHAAGPDGCQVGGFVYRGAAHPGLVGKFLTVDNVSGRVRSFTLSGNTATATHLTDMPSGSVYSGTSTIGKDQAGEPVFIKINGTGSRGRFMKLALVPPATTNPLWYRFEDRHPSNASGYLSDNPDHATADVIDNGLKMVAWDDNATSANVRYAGSNGLTPAGTATNAAGIRIVGAGDGNGYPGNARGELSMPEKLGRLDDFTIELSFNPATGSLGNNTFQCFLGLDGTTGVVPEGGENGPPIQPFRLMRWGRTDDNVPPLDNPGVPLENGDLFLNVRSFNTATQQWRSVALHVLDRTAFTTNRWYHLAIVGRVSTGTLTVYSLENGSYTQLGQATGYVGNLQPGVWSLGRGMFNGNKADWVTDTTFDEVRIANAALSQDQFLYATRPWQPVVVVTNPPALLSETGAFADLATLAPAPGVIPYTVNAPLWSDASAKKRWISLPNDGTHDTPQEKIGFDPEGPWSFPAGTVFIKHFELPTDETNPSVHKRLETRFIVMPATGEPYGVTYKWRADGSDADLLPGGLSEDITIAEAGGGTRIQKWDYPSRTDCRVCHNANAGHVLGLKTWQLNGDLTYEKTGRTANQLETLAGLGWFDSGYRPEQLPWFLKSRHIADTAAPLEVRVRSYLDSNCSHCHQPDGVRARFDARFTTPLAGQGLIQGPLVEPAEERIVMPGNLDHSMLKIRHGSTGPMKMPPLAKNVVDDEAAQVIADWILSLPSAPGVELAAPARAGGPFTVAVHFTGDVTGLAADDFSIDGGSATGLAGSGADYELSVAPHEASAHVSVSLPADSAQGDGHGNYASATHTVVIDEPGLISWLKLDESTGVSVNDSSPEENHGTLVGMEATDRIAGKFGGALRFDNTDERITLGNVAPDDFTVSFWMRTTRTFPATNNPPAGLAIINADSSGPTKDFLIAGTRENGIDRISFQTGNASGAPNMILHATSAVNTGGWVHVACTRVKSSGEMKIYIDGIPEATRTGSTDTLDANPILCIGATPGNAGTSYEGDLDQIRIYSRALTAAEIMDLSRESAALPPYEQWLADRMPGLSHLHGADLDPEHDGTSNFAEFAFGGDPLAPSVFPVPLQQAEDGSVTLSYTARRAPAGAVYQVQVGDTLADWADAGPDITSVTRTPVPGTDYETVTVTYLPPVAGERLFFRIQALPE